MSLASICRETEVQSRTGSHGSIVTGWEELLWEGAMLANTATRGQHSASVSYSTLPEPRPAGWG